MVVEHHTIFLSLFEIYFLKLSKLSDDLECNSCWCTVVLEAQIQILSTNWSMNYIDENEIIAGYIVLYKIIVGSHWGTIYKNKSIWLPTGLVWVGCCNKNCFMLSVSEYSSQVLG
jgi:hypothetical protein